MYLHQGLLYKENKELIDKFLNIQYLSQFIGTDEGWPKWRGCIVQKSPEDLWILHEIIFKLKPDIIIETGTRYGGSALYYADMMELNGKGKVITIDVDDSQPRPYHKRISFINGSSISLEVVEKVKELIKPTERVMVILDSDHTKNHVLEELKLYSNLVTVGQVLLVEDTNTNGHPITYEWNDKPTEGPYEAVQEFLKTLDSFEVLPEKFLVTNNPDGYLRRIK